MRRILSVIFLLLLAGCSSAVSNSIAFPDGTTRNIITIEQSPSILNTALITAVEDPATKTVQTTVQGGTSPGRAVIDVGQTAGLLGMGALIGTGTNSVNLNAAVKP